MQNEEVLYDVSEHIATITLNAPERMNSFSDSLLTGWADGIRRAAKDEDVRVVIITGSGRAFCAGA
ncbi:MAG: enoyl-CoA hydratase/isomerase family protein, partial [Chloroflexi bacterium]|nr:enoyl-CoA hydratase/isomerase family protein [Chloroflexota bacterium]